MTGTEIIIIVATLIIGPALFIKLENAARIIQQITTRESIAERENLITAVDRSGPLPYLLKRQAD